MEHVGTRTIGHAVEQRLAALKSRVEPSVKADHTWEAWAGGKSGRDGGWLNCFFEAVKLGGLRQTGLCVDGLGITQWSLVPGSNQRMING